MQAEKSGGISFHDTGQDAPSDLKNKELAHLVRGMRYLFIIG